MKSKSTKAQSDNTNNCKLKYYNGTFREFAANILIKGRGDGSVCRICTISKHISDDMKTKGVVLLSEDIIITQRQVFKYRKHPKTRKGANIPTEDYDVIENALKNPTHIYEDTVQKRLVYVCTHPYRDNWLVKVVVEPNYKFHDAVMNVAKSWGIVEKSKMNGLQYRKIK